jgi:hypothetical protein
MLPENVVRRSRLQRFRSKRVDIDHFTGLAIIGSFHFCKD